MPIIHRDVKPSNVMLCQDGSVYLLDVNVAKWCNPEEAEDTKLLEPYIMLHQSSLAMDLQHPRKRQTSMQLECC